MNKEKLQQLGHLLAGLITLIHGFDSFEDADFSSAGAYLSLSIMFMIVAGAHKGIIRQVLQGDLAFFLLEAVAIFYSGWHYKATGHPFLYYVMVLASVFFLVCGCMSIRVDERPRRHGSRRHHRRRRRSSSSISGEGKTPGESLNRRPDI